MDGDEEIAEYAIDASGVWASNPLRRYIPGAGIDERIAQANDGTVSNPPKRYYHTNHQGSVIAMTDAAGAVTEKLAYDAYGNLTSEPPAASTGQVFRYTGRRFDEETGLYYYRARYYSPLWGRFLQADPIGYGDDFNLYAYVGNDPLGKVDPFGENATVIEQVIVTGSRAASATPWGFLVNVFLPTLTASREQDQLYPSYLAAKLDNQAKPGLMYDEAKPGTKEAVDEEIGKIAAGGKEKSNHVEVDKKGSGSQAEDFERISQAAGSRGRPIDTQYGPGQAIDLPGGGSASTRPGSSTGPASIQINRPGQKPIKIRY